MAGDVPVLQVIDYFFSQGLGLGCKTPNEAEFISLDRGQNSSGTLAMIGLGDIKQELRRHMMRQGRGLVIGGEALHQNFAFPVIHVGINETDTVVLNEQVGQFGDQLQNEEEIRLVAKLIVKIKVIVFDLAAMDCSQTLQDIPGYTVILPVGVAIGDKEGFRGHETSVSGQMIRGIVSCEDRYMAGRMKINGHKYYDLMHCIYGDTNRATANGT